MAQDEFIFPPTFLSFLWRLFKSLHHFANIKGSGSATTKRHDFHLHRPEHVLVFLMQLMFISKILQLSFCSAYRVEASYSLQTSSSGEELYIVFHHGSLKGLYFRIRTVYRCPSGWFSRSDLMIGFHFTVQVFLLEGTGIHSFWFSSTGGYSGALAFPRRVLLGLSLLAFVLPKQRVIRAK